MSKKIAIITEQTDITLGGAERSILELSDALSAHNLTVDIVAAKGHTKDKNIHVLCEKTRYRRAFYPAFAKALKRYFQENSYDIIHSTLPLDSADLYQPRGGTFVESISRNAASYRNKLLVNYKKLTAIANLRRTLLLGAERKLCANAMGPVIVALSNYVAEQFKQHYGVSSERIVVIHNAVETSTKIDPMAAAELRAQILTQLGSKETDNPVLLLFAANNFRLKGLAVLLEAMRLAIAKTCERPVYLIVAGSDRPYKYRLMARRLGVDKKVLFWGHLSSIQNALSIIDVAILPTFYDACSRYILEAIAAGKPVITTRFNGATDLFVDDRHGKIIDSPEDTGALAQAICHFSNRQNIKKASDAIIEDNLKEKVSINRAAKQLIELYERILSNR